MEFDYTTILYIIFALVYFIFTGASKKRKQQQNQGPSNRPEDASETVGPPPVNRRQTFEELLEQFTSGNESKAPEETYVEPEPEPVVEIPAKPNPIPERVSIYQQRQAEIMARTNNDKNTEPVFGRFEEFEEEEVELSNYAALMREPDGAKKAFVLSEIFNRKY